MFVALHRYSARLIASITVSLAFLLGCAIDPIRPLSSRTDPGASGGGPTTSMKFEDSGWSEPVNLGPQINSSQRELSATLSPDGLSMYIGSTRAGGLGGQDIWVSRRACSECEWEAPVNLTIVNSPANDGDPFISKDGHRLFFASNRDGGYGNDDIYVSHRTSTKDDFTWGPPINVGPPINTGAFEAGASYVPSAEEGSANLYFTRGVVVAQGFDIYYGAVDHAGGAFGDVVKVEELSMDGFADVEPILIGPHEIFFWSTRPGGQGNSDLWTSTRNNPREPWSTPRSTGAPLSTSATELTGRLSHDGRTLLLSAGANRGGYGLQDIWISTRSP